MISKIAFALSVLIILYTIIFRASGLNARDLGQWENTDPEIRAWYSGLMQPDNPSVSCCGEADAYYCDDWYVREKVTYCKITDTRDDEPLKRMHVDIGTEIMIPDYKLKWDKGNPAGHSIVFLSKMQYVFCFVQTGGT
jgi:hypothetical protein